MRNAEFESALLAEVYDAENGWGSDDDFVLELLNRGGPKRVADVGCGTGRVTIALADAGHRVTGVDPAGSSLARARRKPGAERVSWMLGTATALRPDSFDFIIMTAHVAQFLATDEEWDEAFAAIRRALVPGGCLYFDTRDPAVRAWASWTPELTRRHVEFGGRSCTVWTEVTAVRDPAVTVDFTRHYEFDDGEQPTSESTLRFRSEDAVRASLDSLGFVADDILGGWRGEPVGAGELLVCAHRPTDETVPNTSRKLQ